MFYEKFKALCQERNEKPTPLLRSLGFSATNLKRWRNGATVNSGILSKLAKHFDVTVDYFFQENDNDIIYLTEKEKTLLTYFNKLSIDEQSEVIGQLKYMVNK